MSTRPTAARSLEYNIGGMDCASCAGTIQTALEKMPGVTQINVSVARERLKLVLDEKHTDQKDVVKVVEDLGFSVNSLSSPSSELASVGPDNHVVPCCAGESAVHDHGKESSGHAHSHGSCGGDHGHAAEVQPRPGQIVIAIGGMDCASCAGTITAALEKLPGVSDINVSIAREQLSFSLAPGLSAIKDIRDVVERLGFTANEGAAGADKLQAPPAARLETSKRTAWWKTPKARQLYQSGLLVGIAYAATLAFPELEQSVFSLAAAVAVWPIARRAYVAARYGAPFTIQMLMTMAAAGAVIIGEQQEAAIVVLLFKLGEMLEGMAADRARSGIRSLGKLLPREALVEGHNGELSKVPADSLAIGQIIVARTGDRIAADGEVISGTSSVDESPVTGESIPVGKEPGDRVRAGTVNHDATLRVRVDRAAKDNTIARIIAMVEEAQDSKAPTERFIDRFSRVYMPIVLFVAVAVAVLPPLLGGGDWQSWSYRALALLLIGCPCALVISVPAAVASSLSAAARVGMLIKGGAVIETLAGAKRVVFDKTGTLTRGKPAVTDVISLASDSASMLGFAAAIERESSHPLATAIVSHAKEVGDPGLSASDVRIVPGKGMEGVVAGRKIFIGAPRHAETIARLGEVARAQITNLEEQGKTIAVVVGEGTALGLIAMRDDPRPEAHTALDKLKLQSVVPVMMTGDNSRTGAAIGRLLGITSLADMLPEDKSRAVAEMAAKETTIMVGDGVNDAPALAAAHVGVAIGSGTDVAMEAADAALMRDRVDDVPRMIDLARATMDNIRQNVAISLGLKLIFLVTTLMGYTGLWLAVFADTGATVLVTINAMRLLGFFRGRDKGEIAHQIGKYREAAG